MISEGTNIPRLGVRCHLTRVKTAFYFRQVLGRILRSDGVGQNKGYLYVPAELSLIEYSRRVSAEIPKECAINFDALPAIMIQGSDQKTGGSSFK